MCIVERHRKLFVKAKAIYLSKEKVGMFVVYFMLLALSALSYVPSPGQATLFIFVVSYAFFAFFGFLCSGWWRDISFRSIFLFMLALLAIALNFSVSMVGDISIDKWFRSFVPILFFITILLIPFYLRLLGVRKISLLLLVGCLSYCFFLFIFNLDKFYEFLRVGGRLTFYLQDSVV